MAWTESHRFVLYAGCSRRLETAAVLANSHRHAQRLQTIVEGLARGDRGGWCQASLISNGAKRACDVGIFRCGRRLLKRAQLVFS